MVNLRILITRSTPPPWLQLYVYQSQAPPPLLTLNIFEGGGVVITNTKVYSFFILIYEIYLDHRLYHTNFPAPLNNFFTIEKKGGGIVRYRDV